MKIGNYMFCEWESNQYGFYTRKIYADRLDDYTGPIQRHVGSIQIFESIIFPYKFFVFKCNFPFSKEYFEIHGYEPFDSLELAKESIDNFLAKIESLKIFL